MSKFKVGDTVRCIVKSSINPGPDYGVVGHKYTVLGYADANHLILQGLRKSQFGVSERRFELVTNPLVETVTHKVTRTIEEEVTEKKLKDGHYGQIFICNDGSVYHEEFSTGKMTRVTLDQLDETIDALIAVRDHWREIGKIK